VTGGLPGEVVSAHIVHRSRQRAHDWARVVRVIESSPDRVAVRCAQHGRCDGCALMPLGYEAQLRAKHARVYAALPGVPVDAVIPAPDPWHYRGTQKYVVARLRGHTILGSFRARSHAVADMAGCLVAAPSISRAADVIAELLDTSFLTIQHVVIRELPDGLVVTLVGNDNTPEHMKFARRLRERLPEIAAVLLSTKEAQSRGGSTPGETKPAKPSENRIFGAAPQLLDGVAPEDPAVFRQANPAQASRLYEDVANAAGLTGAETVLDLYSGSGAIARALAPLAARVIAVDRLPGPPLPGVETVASDVAAYLQHAPHADLVVVNPPRRGLAANVVQALRQLNPARIIYVSCDPESLGRDLAALAPHYRCARATPYDLLPQTPHVEVVAFLERQTR
jgi:23S rRNA (uracil1939-C5)-methyltransferase